MQLNVPPDLEALVQKRLATGAFADAEDVIRRDPETLEAEENWTVHWRRPIQAGSTDQTKRGGGWRN